MIQNAIKIQMNGIQILTTFHWVNLNGFDTADMNINIK